MQVRAQRLAVLIWLLVTPVLAEEPLVEPTATPVPAPQSVQLLDERPNYAEIMQHQWSEGVPHDVVLDETSTEHYGRLLDTGSPQSLSVADCVALALQNNTELKIQRLGPLAAATQVRRQYGIFDPALFGNVSRDRLTTPNTTISPFTATQSTLFRQNFNFNAGARKTLLSGGQLALTWQNNRLLTNPSVINELVPQYTTTLGLSLNQPLLRDFGWRYSLLLVDVAQNLEQESYELYQASIATIISQVERAYWAYVLAIENVRVQEDGMSLAKELQRENENKFKVGALPQTSVLEAQSEVARREANLIRARNFRDVTRDNLRAVINTPKPDAGALAMIEPADKPTVAPYEINLERSLNTALAQRPELIAARLEVHGRGLQRKAAENQMLPRLNFAGAIGLNGLSGSAAAPVTFGLPGQTPVPVAAANPVTVGGYGRALELLQDGRFYNYSAGATVEIPLDNAQAKADYAAANINLEQARLSLQKLEENVTLEIKQAVSNLDTDLRSIDATRIARELAEENVRNQQARYDVGLATTKDLLDFQDRLTQARDAEVEALTKYNADLAEMRRVEGTLLSARNVVIERAPSEGAPWWASF